MVDRLLIGALIAAASFILIQQARPRIQASKNISKPQREAVFNAAQDRCTDFPKLRWPVKGKAGKDWVISNDIDHDKETHRLRDYRGAVGVEAITYDGHQGIDIEIANFKIMDGGVPISAANDGVVDEVFDDSPDRNLHCSQDKWNFVRLKHHWGTTTYGHLKRGSASVRVGDRVSAGAVLGMIGSSGCSTFPHLHFEVRNCRDEVLDPIQNIMFANMPEDVRSLKPQVMDLSFFQPAIEFILPIQDPEPYERNLILIGHDFSVGVTLSVLRPNDLLSLEFVSPSKESSDVFFKQKITQFLPRSHWWGTYQFAQGGVWTLIVKINGQSLIERRVTATL